MCNAIYRMHDADPGPAIRDHRCDGQRCIVLQILRGCMDSHASEVAGYGECNVVGDAEEQQA